MKLHRFWILFAAAMLPLSGCPGGSGAVTQGVWIFTVVTPGFGTSVGALELLANGATNIPNPKPVEADDEFGAEPIWTQSGSAITLMFGDGSTYDGTVHSSTSMSGSISVPANPDIARWSAIFLQ